MHYRTLPLLVLAGGLLLTGAACGKKVAEKAAEQAVERASNGNVNIDINKNSVKVNINGGSTVGEVGDSVKVPDGFPSDVYVIDGTVKTAIAKTDTKGYTLSINTNLTPAEAKSRYDAKLKEQGWTIVMTLDSGDGATISASKGQRNVSVIISTSDGQTNVILGTSEPEASS